MSPFSEFERVVSALGLVHSLKLRQGYGQYRVARALVPADLPLMNTRSPGVLLSATAAASSERVFVSQRDAVQR